MPEKWTGDLIGRMHNEKITFDELAAQLGVTKSYISMLLNSKRKPPDAQERLTGAVQAIIDRRTDELLREEV